MRWKDNNCQRLEYLSLHFSPISATRLPGMQNVFVLFNQTAGTAQASLSLINQIITSHIHSPELQF